jgi:hypothetical protein
MRTHARVRLADVFADALTKRCGDNAFGDRRRFPCAFD